MSWLDAYLNGAPGPTGPQGPAGPVGSVGATAPITSTGGVSPTIGITAATDSAASSMSAADKTKLDQATASSTPSTLALRGTDGSLSGELVNVTTPVSTPSAPSTGFTVYVDNTTGRLMAIDSSGRISNLVTTMRVSNTKAINGNNTTVHMPIFQVVGPIRIVKLWGVVVSTLGPNHTASSFGASDGTNTAALSASASTPMSNAPVDSFVGVLGTTTSPTAAVLSTQVAANSPNAGAEMFQEIGFVSKNGATTQIAYIYSTTDAPTSGSMTFTIEYEPLSADASVVAV